MNYLKKREEYRKYFIENELKNLEKESVVEDFLEFMEKNLDQDNDYYRIEFKENNNDEENFVDYIYRVHLGFSKDLNNEYKKIRFKSEEKVKKIENQIIRVIKKISILREKKSYEGKKLEFILDFNLGLLKKAEEKNNEEEWKNEAWSRSTWLEKITNWFMVELFDDMEFSAPEQDELYDWKHNINFQELSITESERLLKLKDNGKESYLREFENYIVDYKICEKISKTTKDNYYLFKRLPVIEVAIVCFKDKNYLPFISIIVPQIEGLFTDYMDIIGVKSKGNSITEKLKSLSTKNSLWGYIYYAYEFPKIRNCVAHGDIDSIKIDLQENAFDILLDLSYLIDLIDSDDLDYKKFIQFLIEFGKCENNDKKVGMFIERYLCINNHIFKEGDLEVIEEKLEEEKRFLNRILMDDSDEIIDWYKLKAVKYDVKNTVDSELFRLKIEECEIDYKLKKKVVELFTSCHVKFSKGWKDKIFKQSAIKAQ